MRLNILIKRKTMKTNKNQYYDWRIKWNSIGQTVMLRCAAHGRPWKIPEFYSNSISMMIEAREKVNGRKKTTATEKWIKLNWNEMEEKKMNCANKLKMI